MTKDIKTWDDGRRFVAAIKPMPICRAGTCYPDSLGRGGGESIVAFSSAEARHYYLELTKAQYEAARSNRELSHLKDSLKQMLTPKGRIRGNALRRLIAAS